MQRRRFLFAGLGLLGVSGALGSYVWSTQLMRRPNRHPYLTDTHLRSAVTAQRGPGPEVLFVGNSALLRHDVPALVAQRAERHGIKLSTVRALANGAHLGDSARITALRDLLRQRDWAAIVLQDFSATSLRSIDRWASRRAIRDLAGLTEAPVFLMPHWPSKAGSRIYSNRKLFAPSPQNPEAWQAANTAFFGDVAVEIGARLVPIEEALRTARDLGLEFYARDFHHSSPAGAALVADVLWRSLAPVVTELGGSVSGQG